MLGRNVLTAFAIAVAMVGFGGHAATAEEVTLKVISAYSKTHNFKRSFTP